MDQTKTYKYYQIHSNSTAHNHAKIVTCGPSYFLLKDLSWRTIRVNISALACDASGCPSCKAGILVEGWTSQPAWNLINLIYISRYIQTSNNSLGVVFLCEAPMKWRQYPHWKLCERFVCLFYHRLILLSFLSIGPPKGQNLKLPSAFKSLEIFYTIADVCRN